MKFKITYHKDILGNAYYAIDINRSIIGKYIVELREEIVDLKMFNTHITNQSKRDRNKHHITIFNAINVGSLIKYRGEQTFLQIIEEIEKLEITDLKFLGLGTASRGENTSYYVVVQSDTIDSVFELLNMKKKDLHITIGFNYSDVNDVPKNEILAPKSKFKLKLAEQFYENNESFEWIRNIHGFSGNDDLIQPIFIGESWATFRIGDFEHISITLIDDELYITNSWQEKKIKPILSHTIVYRKLHIK